MRIKQVKKMRKSMKYGITIFAIILMLLSFFSLEQNLSKENIKTKTKEIYKYTNKFNYDYKVNLIENKYMNEEDDDKTLVYVTDLIDTTQIFMNYEYLADKESQIKYDYLIEGNMKVVYIKDGEEQKIIDEKETIIEKNDQEFSGNDLKINESFDIDLKSKNEMLNDFKQKMGMNIDAKYIITLKVKVNTNIEENEVNSDYQSIVQINLAEKTTKILGENNKEESKYISKEYNVSVEKNIYIIIFDIILIVISIIILIYLRGFKIANNITNEYRKELNKILKLCQDKIVQVNTNPNENDNIIDVKDFEEIVKVSEELFKPILYYFDNENQEAIFCVITGKITYRFILKR